MQLLLGSWKIAVTKPCNCSVWLCPLKRTVRCACLSHNPQASKVCSQISTSSTEANPLVTTTDCNHKSGLTLLSTQDFSHSGKESYDPFNQSVLAPFSRAFIIGEPGDNHELLIAVILYNMGLVHHVRASRSEDLSTALHLYRVSLQLIRKETIKRSRVSGISHLLMALTNNIAQVYSQYFCFEETGNFLKELHGLLSTEETFNSIDHEAYQVFFINTVTFFCLLKASSLSTSAPVA